jgi:hypothetical protein
LIRRAGIFPVEGEMARREFVQHTTCGVQIATLVNRVVQQLLWRHVRKGAGDAAWRVRHRHRRADRQNGLAGDGRQTEIENLHQPFRGDAQIRGLEVAMQNAGCVRGGQTLRQLHANPQDFLLRQRARRHAGVERQAANQFADE